VLFVCSVIQTITQLLEQFGDALKTSIMNGLACTGLRNANCEGDDIEILDNLHTLLKESGASQPNSFTSLGGGTLHVGLSGSCIAEQMQREVNDVDVDLFSVAYVSGSTGRRATCCEV